MKNKKKKEKLLKRERKTYQWPKRRVLRRLGPFSSSVPSITLPVAYFVVNSQPIYILKH